MAERRRGKKKLQEITEKPTKVETAVAKHLRFNVPTKEGKLVGLPVQYFIASDAVNCLLESKWSSNKNKTDPLFTNRSSCVDFCNTLLLKGMFHRAGRIERRKDKDRKKKKPKEEAEERKSKRVKDEAEKEEEKKEKREKKSRRRKDEEEKKEESEEEKKKDGDNDKEEKKEEEKKKKKKEKKIRLEMVDHQVFKDGDEIYVWIYDPVPFKTFIIGLFLVLGAIGVCLFPLWPPEVRLGVYYISLTVAGLIGCLLALCVIRVIIFAFIWLLTLGRHHFWLLPNLNEDVGFFDSFRPLYHYEYHGDSSHDDEDDGDGKTAESTDGSKPTAEDKEKSAEAEEEEDEEEEDGGVEEEAEKEPDSGTGSELDNDNGYEIVDRDDIPPDEDDENDDDDGEGDEDETKKDK